MDHRAIRDASFPDATLEDWKALAGKALKGADPDLSLTSRSDDGIAIHPLYPRAEPRYLPRNKQNAPWTFVQRIDDPDPKRANRQAIEDIEQGATGLALIFEGAPNAFGYGLPSTQEALETVLNGIDLTKTHLRIDVHPQSRVSVDWLVQFLSSKPIDPKRLDLAFGIDPAALFSGTGRLRMSIEALSQSTPPSLAHFFAMNVPGILIEADGRPYHNAGATEAQELGGMLAAAICHLRMFESARQPLQHSVAHLGFALSVDQDQLLSMAKIRALRLLWQRVQEVSDIKPVPARIHAETSWRMMSFKDPETNILRNTIAAFAAISGGSDSLAILPHTIRHGLPEGLARRIARNTHLVLAGESRLDFVNDPGSGSGAVESLTDELCAAAWAEFQRIEAEGGILASLKDGHFQKRISASAQQRSAQFTSSERAIIGTNLYPAKHEREVEIIKVERRPAPTDGAIFCDKLEAIAFDQQIGDNA